MVSLYDDIQQAYRQQQQFCQSSNQQVLNQLIHFCQSLVDEGNGNDQSQSVTRWQLCKLVTTFCNTSRPVAIPQAAASILISSLRKWADIGFDTHETSRTSSLQHAAVVAVGELAHVTLAQLPAPEVAALIAVLLSNLQVSTSHKTSSRQGSQRNSFSLDAAQHDAPYSNTPSSPRSSSGNVSNSTSVDWVDMATAVVATLGKCFPKNQRCLLAADAVNNVLAGCVSSLNALCSGAGRPIESGRHAGLYLALVRLITSLIQEAKKSWTQHSTQLVEALRRLICYGVNAAASSSQAAQNVAAPPAASTAGQNTSSSSGAYRPPHLRGQSRVTGAPAAPAAGGGTSGDRWSDSEASDNDMHALTDRQGYGKLRQAVLLCLQSMARADVRAMHPHLPSLLPVQQPLATRPLVPHLVTSLLYDPVPKIRSLAAATVASLLEGSASKGYLMVAEVRAGHSHNTNSSSSASTATPSRQQHHQPRAFMTLSTTLGNMLTSSHEGLLHALQQHASLQDSASLLVTSSIFHALCGLVRAAPVERLQPCLLPETVQKLRSGWQSISRNNTYLQLPNVEQSGTYASYMACLAEVMNTKKAIPSVHQHLLAPMKDGHHQGSTGSGLAAELLVACRHSQPTVRIEALAALKGLSEHYLATISDVWEDVRGVVDFSLSAAATSPSRPNSRAPSLSGTSLPSPRGQPGRGSAQLATAGNTTAGSAHDKACQHAVKLLAGYLTSQATAAGCGPSKAQVFEEDVNGFAVLQLSSAFDVVKQGVAAAASVQGSVAARRPRSAGGAQRSTSTSASTETFSTDISYQQQLPHESIRDRWVDAYALLERAAQHESGMVRAAALTAMSDIPGHAFAALPASRQQDMLCISVSAVKLDLQPAVCSAGCKVLGSLAAFGGDQSVKTTPSASSKPDAILDDIIQGITVGMQHANVSVRVAAAWAAATACEAYSAAQVLLRQSMQVQTEAPQQGSQSHHTEALKAVAMQAGQDDSDKVKTHGLRALGALMHIASLSSAEQDQSPSSWNRWTESAASCVQRSLTTGTPKVQVAACHAAQAFFENPSLQQIHESPSLVSNLLLVLSMLVRDCANFKVRASAAAALTSLSHRSLFGVGLGDTISIVCTSLENLENGNANATVPNQQAAVPGDFQYIGMLKSQLRASLVKLLSMAEAGDVSNVFRKKGTVIAEAVEAFCQDTMLMCGIQDQNADLKLPERIDACGSPMSPMFEQHDSAPCARTVLSSSVQAEVFLQRQMVLKGALSRLREQCSPTQAARSENGALQGLLDVFASCSM